MPPTDAPRPPRLVVVDVDGTLLNSRHELTAPTRAEVAAVRARGVEVLLATSRGPRALAPVLAALDMAGLTFVSCQGALTGRLDAAGRLDVEAETRADRDAALRVVRTAAELGIAVSWYAGTQWLVSAADRTVRREAEIVRASYDVADLTRQRRGPHKLMLVAPTGDPAEVAEVARRLPDGLVAQVSNPDYLEVTAAGVDKAAAVADHCRRLGIDTADVMAIGDGPNDLGLFALAGTSVAPANARPEVLQAADLVIGSNDDDGVARLLASLGR